MIDHLIFLNRSWIGMVITMSIVVWCIFIWKEWKQPLGKRFWIHIFIGFLAILSVGFIALQPAVLSKIDHFNAVVLTDGYDKKQLDSLTNRNKLLKKFSYKANTLIFENEELPDTLFILGKGVQPFDLWQFDHSKVYYRGSKMPSGVIQTRYNPNSILGEDFIFKGLYANPMKGNRLVLRGLGGVPLDSVILSSDQEQVFQLKTKPKAVGRFLYVLEEKDSLGKHISENPIPLQVERPDLLRILIINSFPSFETKYLKNLLTEMGHEVIVKSQITRNRFKFEYFNTEKRSFSSLSENSLQNFDLLITDGDTYKNLGTKKKTALENNVKEEGLGVFIQPDINFFQSSRNLESFRFESDREEEVVLSHFEKIKISKFPYVLKNQFLFEKIHTNEKGDVVSGYSYFGKGKVSTATFKNTYELWLKGNKEAYRQLWVDILKTVAKPRNKSTHWNSPSSIAYRNQPFSFQIKTTINEPTVKLNEESRIPLKNDIDFPGVWQGTAYPVKNGWNCLHVLQDSTAVLNFYVTDTMYWKAKNEYRIIQKNQQFSNDVTAGGTQRTRIRSISMFPFLMVFLLCIGYLWLAPKLMN